MNFYGRILSFIMFSAYAVIQSLKIKSDLVFATSTPLTIAIPALIIKKIRGHPLVFEVRDLWPKIPIAIGELKSTLLIYLSKKLECAVYKASKRIIALSPGMATGIQSKGIPKNRITIIPNAAERKRFSVPRQTGKDFRNKFLWLKNRPLVVYAGSLGKINGVSYLVHIAKTMRSLDPEVRFLIAGNGKEKNEIISLAMATGVYEKTMFFIPPVSKQVLPTLLSAATVCTSVIIPIPELTYNSANKFFDGLAAGRPMIINYGGWQKNILESKGAGFVLPYKNTDQAARMLHSLLDNHKQLKAMERAASRTARQFDIEVLAQKFILTINSVK
jgi:glycosyltransferase involved in cell wall biosynthesis